MECPKETWSAWEANSDCDIWDHLKALSNLASPGLPEMVVWVVGCSRGKRSLGFEWHQVARKS
jgi:hypothetical protein